jgi:hypothetical protein
MLYSLSLLSTIEIPKLFIEVEEEERKRKRKRKKMECDTYLT